MPFDPKKYTQKYKMRLVQNKKRHDKLLSVEKTLEKKQGRPKNQVKVVKK